MNKQKTLRVAGTVGHGVGYVIGLILKIIGALLLILITTGLIFACIFAVYVKNSIEPDVYMTLESFSLKESSTIYYQDSSTGEWLELDALYSDENRIWVDYSEIPIELEHAAVAIEDQRFYDHHGVDWYRTSGAFVNMFLGMKDTFGGSTITQQLIKNLTKEDDVTVTRKLTEIFKALELEKNYTKEEIIEHYLNTIYLGEGCFGVATAAEMYFGKDVSELDLAECASLIGITNNPSMYDPYIDKQANKERQETILRKMYELGYITKEQHDSAVAEELAFKRGENTSRPEEKNSWYVDQVIYDVTDALSEIYPESVVEKMLYTGGLKIYACVDMDIQNIIDSVYEDRSNLDYTSRSGQQMQSAITVIDPYTGYVVGMSGGIGEKTGSLEWNRATMTVRQPGSSIKPVAVYAPAINLGLITPNTIMEDTPLVDYGNGAGYPRNSNGRYSGLVTVSTAVQWSYNTIPAKLVNQMTPQVSYDFMVNNLHFTTLVDHREVNGKIFSDIDIAPLSMGGLTDGVSTMEMTAAYAAFPNRGMYYKPKTFILVTDSDGNTLVDNSDTGTTAMKETTAYYMNRLLSTVATSGTGASANFGNMAIAGKTGTTDKNYDRWFAGYTPYYAAVVWTGYDNPENMNTGYTNPAIGLWKSVMSQIHANLEYKSFFTTDQPLHEILNNLTEATSLDDDLDKDKEEEETTPPEEDTGGEEEGGETTEPSDPVTDPVGPVTPILPVDPVIPTI